MYVIVCYRYQTGPVTQALRGKRAANEQCSSLVPMYMAVRRLGVTFCHLLPGPAPLEPSAKRSRQKVTRQKVPAEGPMKMCSLFVVIWIIKFLQCIIFIIDLASSQATNCCPCDLPNMIADRGRSALKYRACAQKIGRAHV